MNSPGDHVTANNVLAITTVRKTEAKKKIRGTESSLYNSICPLVYVFRVFGVAPYEFDDDQLVPSNVNMTFSFVCVILYTYIIFGIITSLTNVDRQGKPVLGQTEIAKTATNYVVAVFDIILSVLTREKFVRIWNILQDYDEAVKNICYARNEKKTREWVWWVIIFNLIIWAAINQLGMNAFAQSFIDNASYLIIYIGSAVSVTKFAGIVLMLGQRFQHLNEIAQKSAPIGSSLIYTGPVVDEALIDQLHNHLMIAGENLDSLYSWSIMFWLANLTLHTVSDLYFVISWLLDSAYFLNLMNCLLAWLTSFIWQLFLLNWACNFASDEASCMGYIMLEWKRWFYSRNRSMTVDPSLHLINRKLNFTAAGCFNVNLHLLRSIAGLLTTYLVILLQID